MKATRMISDCKERFVKRCKGGEHCVRTTEGRGIYFRRGGEKAGSTDFDSKFMECQRGAFNLLPFPPLLPLRDVR